MASTLVGAGAVGRACKIAFSYGLETDQAVAARFLAKLTLQAKHSYIQPYIAKVKPPRNCTPLKAVTDAFSSMPKKSAAHRDGWTWELLRDAAQTPSTASLLRRFSERTLLQRSLTERPVGVPCFCASLPVPQEAAGGTNVYNRSGSKAGNGGVSPHSLRMQGYGANE